VRKKRLSFRVRDELVGRIASGRVEPGGRLPPEPELAEELGVSRATLREALRSLEEDGFVTRTQGAGTYATRRPRLRNNLDVNFGVTEAIRAAGRDPGTAELSVSTEPAAPDDAAELDLSPGDPVVVIDRIRTADGRRVVWSRDVVSAARLPSRKVVGLGEGSLYDLLERAGTGAVHHGVVTIEPVVADDALAERLDVEAGTPLLFLRQVDFDRDGEPAILSYEHHVASEFEFTVVRKGPGRSEE
jgi:GntR family transcriptional regulator